MKLYYTEKENAEVPLRFIDFFFKGNFVKINDELSEYSVDEIDDLYLNIK